MVEKSGPEMAGSELTSDKNKAGSNNVHLPKGVVSFPSEYGAQRGNSLGVF